MVGYLVKLVAAKSMRSLVSLVLLFKTPTQTASSKPAITIHLEKIINLKSSSKSTKKRLIRVDVYLPNNASGNTLPTLINLHGSGFLLSTFGDDSRFCKLMADQVNCAVLDVAYSKAPENPFPDAQEDALSVIEWIKENNEINQKLKSTGVRLYSDRVALTGFSSGGNLVLTTCIRAKDIERLEMIKAVIAFYPSTNLAESPYKKPNMKTEKGEAGADMPPFVRQFLYSCYVPASLSTPRSSPFISPVNATTDAFPPSVTIVTCSGDSLAREGQQVALKIQEMRNKTMTSTGGDKKVLNETAKNGVIWWEAKGQGHNWDKLCKEGSDAAKKRDYAYALTAERLKVALC